MPVVVGILATAILLLSCGDSSSGLGADGGRDSAADVARVPPSDALSGDHTTGDASQDAVAVGSPDADGALVDAPPVGHDGGKPYPPPPISHPAPFEKYPSWRPAEAPGLAAERTAGASCTGPAATAAVLCVDDDYTGGDDQGTAQKPYRTVGGAIAAAKSGDLIQVAAGVYRENVRLQEITIELQGGFAGGGDFDTRQPAVHTTTIRGVGGDAVLSALGARLTVSGFRLTGGTGNEIESDYFYLGGGVFVFEGSVRILHNLIEGNDLTVHTDLAEVSSGGGVSVEAAEAEIRGNVIRHNRAGRGAVATVRAKVRIEGNAVLENVAVGDHGGGLYLSGADLVVSNNLVAGNRVVPTQGEGGWGGGILLFERGTDALLSRNVVTENEAPEGGAGVFVDDGAQATLTNELIYGNLCPSGGAAALYVDGLNSAVKSGARLVNCTIAAHPCSDELGGTAIVVENSDVSVRNSIIWDNSAVPLYVGPRSTLSVDYSLSQGTTGATATNLSADPQFADAQRGDFHLASSVGRYGVSDQGGHAVWIKDGVHSPAIDAADPSAAVDGELAPNGGRRNLGAYGGTPEASLSR